MLGNGNTRFFQRYKGKRFRKRDGRRALAAILCACMLAPSCIDAIQARALEGTGLCEHHPVHDEMCGYQEAQEARPCTHTHDRECGYTPASEGTACDMGCPVMHAEGCSYRPYEEEIPCDMGCVDEDGDGIIDHAEGCAYRPAVEEIPCDMDCPVEHLEGCAYTPATEGTPCGHVHDENCGYQEEREEQPCTFECAVCAAADKQEEETGTTPVLEWQWIDEQEMLTWDETAQAWTLALIGAGEENPVTREMLAEFLPQAVEAKLEENSGEDPETLVEESTEPPAAETEGRMETLQITWDLSAFPEGEVYEGSYPLSALLPEGCMLAENAPALAVTVQLGGAEMYKVAPTPEQLNNHIVQGIDPAGTTVNLFDYTVRVKYPGTDPSGDLLSKSERHMRAVPSQWGESSGYSSVKDWWIGINKNHFLLFGDGIIHAGLWNKGAGENTDYGKDYAGMEGIVQPVLSTLSDGSKIPLLNLDKAEEILVDEYERDYQKIGDYLLAGEHVEQWTYDKKANLPAYTYDGTDIQNLSKTLIQEWETSTGKSFETHTEELGYLFSKWSTEYKSAYNNVKGLFQMDDSGYYYYNMRKNFAEFKADGKSGTFILYDAPATRRTDGKGADGKGSIGNFFPFNKGAEVFDGVENAGTEEKLTSDIACSGNAMNHHLGMTVTTEFRQPADGMVSTGTEGKKPMTFEFSGDDDVWVFIDDVLVLDLGGVHSELYGTIDFSDGTICIGRGFGAKEIDWNNYPDTKPTDEDGIPNDPENDPRLVIKTNLKEMFEKAGKVNEVRWRDDTFASESDHTLKMFYLERGNYDSSLAIRFNLQPRLEHEVKKVDQNGVPVKDVEFNLYPAAEGTGEDAILCTNAKDASASGSKYVVQTGDNVLATLKTDENGIGNFIDSSIKNGDGGDVPFNFADFYDPDRSQGQYYILKEQNAPQGYRMLPIPIVLEYDKDTSLLTVANRWTTGAHASFVSHISGNGDITYGAYKAETGNVEINPDKKVNPDAQKDGLAVAVPMSKQTVGKNTVIWKPMYGLNLKGLEAVALSSNTVEEWRTAALKAALYQSALLAQAQAEGDKTVTADWHLVWNETEKHLEGTLTDLPGNALRYRMNNPAHPEKADMRMEYALITPEALKEIGVTQTDSHEKYIALGNAVRSHGGTLDEAVDAVAEQIMAVVDSSTGSGKGFSFLNVDQFNRSFRSQIYIPNEQRELRVLKVDQDGKAVNAAEFTLYSDEDCTQAAAHGTTNTVDGQDGMLIFAPYVDNSRGHATMKWENASNTQYYLKETKAPTGCKTNNTVIPVIVGTYSIYADAGTPEDGVTVMAGVGKLTQTMHKYASENAIDVTLRDISAFAQTQPSGTFRLDGWKDMKLENTDLERDMNLHYGKNAVIDYGLHDVDGGKNYKPYFVTDSGFIRARVEQNAAALGGGMYGESITTNWDNLGKTDITSLFSLLNTVVVTNQTDPDSLTGQLEISKRLQGEGLADADYKKNFKFQVTLTDAGGVALPGKYYFYGTDKTGYVSSGDILPLHHDESITILGLPVGAKYQVTEEQEGGWHVIKPASGTADGTIENDITADAEFINSRQDIPPTGKGSLTVKKTVTGNQGDKNKLFTFDISLGDNTLNGTYGEITFTNGKAVITLKDGEQKTAENLPAKITYMVTEREANQDGYTTSSQNTAGTIPADGNSTAAFTNNKSGGGNTPGGGGSDKPDPPRDPDPPKEPEDPEEPVIPEQPEEPVIPEQPEEPVSPDVPELPDTPQELSSTPDGPDDLSIYDDGVPRDGRDRENSKYPGLPQTGIVWRTVLLLAAAGVLLLAAGAAQNRKDRNGKR